MRFHFSSRKRLAGFLVWSLGSVAALAQLPGNSTGNGPTIRGERLVPAAMGIRTDKQGNSWNIEQNGTLERVGNSMVNSGAQLLLNNNQQFYTYQPMMTADGSEFVLHSRPTSGMTGLQVVRRIRLLENEGIVRYLEIFTNVTSNPLNLNVSLRNNFSGNYKSYLTDQGNSGVVMLGQRERAVLVTPGSSQSNRAFVFSLCSPKSMLKPIISSQNKYGLTFQYNLSLPPGQTAVLVHAISQVPVPRSFERQDLARLFKPVRLERLVKTIPRELRPLLVNYQVSGEFGADALLTGKGADSLGVDRGRRDVLAMGENTRLIGAASCGKFTLKTEYGEADIPFPEIAAVVGSHGGRRDRPRVFLKDGQIYSGEVVAEDLRFVMASGGKMNLDVRALDRLVRLKSENEGEWGAGVVAMLETFGGDRIAVGKDTPLRLSGMTPWGALEFGLDEILWLAPAEDEPVGHYVEFKDGNRCFVFLSGDSLEIGSPTFGNSRIGVTQVRAAVTRAAIERARSREEQGTMAPDEPAILQTYLTAAGNQRIVGDILNESINVLTNAESIPVAPAEIRRLTNVTAENGDDHTTEGPYFRIELWGGGVMAGFIRENFIDIRVRGRTWQVPVQDLRELITPVPKLSDAARQEIAQLMRQMASVDWKTREIATEALAGDGYLAKSYLEEELRTNPDPEVQRRIERILTTME